jgi:sec-independent protein translocase protein TatC
VSLDQITGSITGSLPAWLWQPVAPFTGATWAMVIGLLIGLLVIAVLTVFLAVPWARRWWYDETTGPNEDERGVSTVEMTLIEHLFELRNRLVIAAIALGVTTAGAFVFYRRWMDIAVAPLKGHQLQAIDVTETVFSYFQVTLVVGLIVAMPVIAYQAWAYIAPGLTRKERRYVIAVIPGATISFIAGVCFAYFVLVPAALAFLLNFGDDQIVANPAISRYISFLSRLLIAVGAIFQLPLVLFFLAKVHLINPKMLGSFRRYVVVAAFVIAAVVTPTPDPFNQLLVAIPILVLYEIGALLARLA